MNEITIFNYEGSPVTFDNGETRMVNATEMAKPFGKRVNDWFALSSTKEFMKILETTRNNGSLVKTIEGRNGGTWMHEDVALEFARWLSPKFAIWCNDRIKELVRNGYNTIQPICREEGEARRQIVYIEYLRKTLRMSDASFSQMMNPILAANGIPEISYVEQPQGATHSATELLKTHGSPMSIYQFNKAMIAHGFLEKKTRKASNGKEKSFNSVTDEGLVYGKNDVSPKNSNETQPHYYDNKFAELLRMIK